MLQFISAGHALGFSAGGVLAATGSHALHVDFVGAHPVQPQSDTPAGVKGQSAPLGRITYTDLWDGISLDYSTQSGSIYTITYTLAPGANPAYIRLHYNAALTLNRDGALEMAYQTGTLSESAPVAWQQINGQRVPVAVSFRLDGQLVGFTLGTYNPAYTLIIDPSLVWNTFLGGSVGDDVGSQVAVDGSGNVFVIGTTDAPGTSNASWGTPVRAFSGYEDAFVAKLNASGTLLWNTFLGSSLDDEGYGIAVDSSGNVYVTGLSHDTWGSPLRAYEGGGWDAFVAKLSSNGTLVWNTFLGGYNNDEGHGIGLDDSGNVYVSGWSKLSWGTPVHAYNADADAFVAKLSSGGALVWNTFFGCSGWDGGNAIAVDGSGNSYVTGNSGTTWGTPLRAYVSGYDTYVAKVNSSGALVWNTFIGGTGMDDQGNGIAVDVSGNVYVSGHSSATWGAPVRAFSGTNWDAFVAKLNPGGALSWNTFLGSSDYDDGDTLDVDGSGNVFVTGSSSATWGAPLRAYSGNLDAFAAMLNSSGVLQANTFLGASGYGGYDEGHGTALDGSGNVVVTGTSTATWGTPVRAISTSQDAFVAKVNFPAPPAAATLVSPLATVTTTHTPTYIWSKVTNATLYRLWVKNSTGAWVMQNLYSGANICGVTNCAFTPTTSLPNGTYTWFIQTLTTTQNGAWSSHSFTVAVPVPGVSTLVSPKGTIHTAKPTFIWSKDSAATLYRLWIKNNTTSAWVIQNLYAGKNICGVTNCAIVSPVTLANGSYTWYIDTLTATQNGQWSAQAITVSVPDALPSPSTGEGGVKP